MKSAALTVFCLGLLAFAANGCRREQRRFTGPPSDERVLQRGEAPAAHDRAELESYGANAWAISEGQRLFSQMNCVGCHAHGGGGMGPALMDARFRYGGRLEDIERSIANGRPRGMPAFASHLSPKQIWQVAAYVRSLSGNAPSDSAPGRDDHMAVSPPPSRTSPQPPVPERVD